jgi:uncharacterized protein
MLTIVNAEALLVKRTRKARPTPRLKIAAVAAAGILVVGGIVAGAYVLGLQAGVAELAARAPAKPAVAAAPVPTVPATVPVARTAPPPYPYPFSEQALRDQRPVVQPLRPAAPPAPAETDYHDDPEVPAPKLVEQAPAAPAEQVAALPPVAALSVPPAQTQPLWLANAVPARLPLTRPSVAIVIDDMGVDRKRSAAMLALPRPLTLSYLPYGANIAEQAAAGHKAGHELMVHLPMEPLDGSINPGPDALLTRLPAEELRARLQRNLSQFSGYVGVNNHMGSRFTENAELMRDVLVELNQRGLLFLDSRTTAHSVGDAVGRQVGLPHIGRDVFLDHDMSPEAIAAALAQVEQLAARHGTAVAIGHPHDDTRRALEQWLPTLAAKGIDLVPLSAIVRTRWKAPAAQSAGN